MSDPVSSEKDTGKALIDRYRRLVAILQELAATLDLDALLHQTTWAAADLCEAEHASILLFHAQRGELSFQTATNQTDPPLQAIRVPVENSLAGWMITHNQPVVVNDIHREQRLYRKVEELTGVRTRSLLGVPLVSKSGPVGALEVINKRAGQFTREDLDLLLGLGALAAVAIENARLFQQSGLVSELVHELSTPLTSLNTAARLLVDHRFADSQRDSLAQTIISETGRLAEMLSIFLDLSRLESGRASYQMNQFDSRELAEDVRRLMEREAQVHAIDLHLVLPVQPLLVFGDPARLKQVLINLVSNAIKYNRPGGMVEVTLQAQPGEVEFIVEDSGVGMSPEELSHMFEKFYRAPGGEAQVQGTGLGLYISQHIVAAHHGVIEVTSQEGSGSRFTVRLPAAKAPPSTSGFSSL